MSASKESNSSKTAHVMNLLSRNRATPAESPAEAPAEAAPREAAAQPTETAVSPSPAPAPVESAPQSVPPTSPIIASLSSDHAISSQIKDALASSLEELAESEPVAETPAAPVVEEAPQPEPVVETPAEPVVEDPTAEKSDEEKVICANIMEILVERKAETYMELFGLCCCDRCKMDVQALALTELPAKYVVMGKNELPLRLSLYEGRMNTAITAQILRACKVVLAEPRHKLFPF